MPKSRLRPTKAQVEKRIKTLEGELWDLEQVESGEYALHGLKLADVQERLWSLKALLAGMGSRPDAVAEATATKFALKWGEQRARMSDKVKHDLLPKLEKALEERKAAGARLQAVPRRVTH